MARSGGISARAPAAPATSPARTARPAATRRGETLMGRPGSPKPPQRRPPIGDGRNGNLVAIPLGATSGVPGGTALTLTPSPSRLWGKPEQHGLPERTPATTRRATSVTSSFGRRPFGHPAGSGVALPAASWASGPRRRGRPGG